MIQSKFVILSQSSALDNTSNAFSLFNIVDEIVVDAFPAKLGPVDLCALFKRDIDLDNQIQLITLELEFNNKQLFLITLEIDFKNSNYNRTIVKIRDLPFDEPGEFSMIYSIGDKEIGRYDVAVNSRNGEKKSKPKNKKKKV